jgi:hypothetical protein
MNTIQNFESVLIYVKISKYEIIANSSEILDIQSFAKLRELVFGHSIPLNVRQFL